MSRMRYEVDWWSDPAYPKIVPCGDDGSGDTFTECKAEIIEHAANQMEHWKLVKERAKKLTTKDVY